MKRVLVYVRPFSKELFTDVIKEAIPGAQIFYFSDYQECADYWTGDYIYDSSFDNPAIVTDEELEDIVSRDRTLRNRLKKESELLVRRLYSGVEKLYREHNFEYFITLNVDCYTIDILLRLSDRFGIKAISFLGSFMSGYAWFNLRGERNPLNRGVSNEEAQRVLDSLTKKYYLPASESEHVKQQPKDIMKFYYRRKVVEEVYYPLMRILKRDKWNCFYNMCNWSGKRLSEYYNSSFEKMFEHIENVKVDDNTVYFPMHFIPEATTDYWCEDIASVGYNNYVINLIEKSDPRVKWLIKEHPAMYGKRELSFYKALKEHPNVTVIHPLDRSNDLLGLIQTVVVDNGTVGVEAAIRGKRVLALSRNYYEQLHPNVHRVESISIDDLRCPLTDYDNLKFISDLLDGLFESDYRNGKDQDKCNREQIIHGFKLLIQAKGWDNVR